MDQYQEKRGFNQFDRFISINDVAYISDAGTPGISDPGALLVRYCCDHGIHVKCFPGPSSLSTFISGSGILMGGFHFFGFFPRKASERLQAIDFLVSHQLVGIWFESPKRIGSLMKWLADHYDTAEVVLANDLTKSYEQYFRGTVDDVKNQLLHVDCRGEWVGCIDGRSIVIDNDAYFQSVATAFQQLKLNGRQVKGLSQLFKLPKNKMYQLVRGLDD